MAEDWGSIDSVVLLLFQVATIASATYWVVYHPVAGTTMSSAVKNVVLMCVAWAVALWALVPLAYTDLIREDSGEGQTVQGWIEASSHAAAPAIKTVACCAAVVLLAVLCVELFAHSRKRFVRTAAP
jgi:hypothetical protein